MCQPYTYTRAAVGVNTALDVVDIDVAVDIDAVTVSGDFDEVDIDVAAVDVIMFGLCRLVGKKQSSWNLSGDLAADLILFYQKESLIL